MDNQVYIVSQWQKTFMSFRPAEITENTIASFEKAIDQVSVLHVLCIVTSCVHDGWC